LLYQYKSTNTDTRCGQEAELVEAEEEEDDDDDGGGLVDAGV
jgi:hypothetical protein